MADFSTMIYTHAGGHSVKVMAFVCRYSFWLHSDMTGWLQEELHAWTIFAEFLKDWPRYIQDFLRLFQYHIECNCFTIIPWYIQWEIYGRELFLILFFSTSQQRITIIPDGFLNVFCWNFYRWPSLEWTFSFVIYSKILLFLKAESKTSIEWQDVHLRLSFHFYLLTCCM